MRRILFLGLVLAIALAAAACSNGGNTCNSGDALEGPIVSFPYIFSGTFTVNGEPGPAGTSIFARMGGTHSPIALAPVEGHYNNIVIGPSSEQADDLCEPVKFYLGSLDGPSVEAKETFEFKVVGAPTQKEINLTFPSLP